MVGSDIDNSDTSPNLRQPAEGKDTAGRKSYSTDLIDRGCGRGQLWNNCTYTEETEHSIVEDERVANGKLAVTILHGMVMGILLLLPEKMRLALAPPYSQRRGP